MTKSIEDLKAEVKHLKIRNRTLTKTLAKALGKTKDGVEVLPGDTVYIVRYCQVHEVKVLTPRADYMLYGNLLSVSETFSTGKAAQATIKTK